MSWFLYCCTYTLDIWYRWWANETIIGNLRSTVISDFSSASFSSFSSSDCLRIVSSSVESSGFTRPATRTASRCDFSLNSLVNSRYRRTKFSVFKYFSCQKPIHHPIQAGDGTWRKAVLILHNASPIQIVREKAKFRENTFIRRLKWNDSFFDESVVCQKFFLCAVGLQPWAHVNE